MSTHPTKASIEVRPFATLGSADHGWLDARHHFSFADYRDPDRMNWGALRVWNDDTIQPQTGFPPHPHQDMEIITYVRTGAITHEDSLGNKGRTVAGDVQVMSAGTGIRHAEFNLEDEETTLFQIWILPDSTGAQPGWATRPFPDATRGGALQVLASGYPADADALPIRASARVFGARLEAGRSVVHAVESGRHAYLVPATGKLDLDGTIISARDGVAIGEGEITLRAVEDSEFVLVDTA